jgi:uncharacterized membrane protein YfcA
MTELQMLVAAGAFIVAGIAKGAIGMGMPPIAIGLMSFAIPLQDSMALMVLPAMVTNVWQAIYGPSFAPLMRRFGSMSAGTVLGIFLVVVTFGQLGSQQVLGWVGVLLVVYSALALTAWRPAVSRAQERWANPLIGVASGAAAAITGVAAIPFLPYMQSLDMSRHDLVQALGILFVFILGALTVALAWQGAFHLTNTIGGVAALAPTMLGVWLGQKGRRALSAEMFRRIFLAGMLGIGLHMASRLL